jgi:enamine deaminase RidA (YjgF/YER057c/UK114 family)
LRDFSNYQKLVEIRREFYSVEHPPASSAVAVSSLVDSRFLLEVEGIAVTPAIP